MDSSLSCLFSSFSCVFLDNQKQFPVTLLWFWKNVIDLWDLINIYRPANPHGQIDQMPVLAKYEKIISVCLAFTAPVIDYLTVSWMGWTKLLLRLLKASYAQHVWWTSRAPRSFKGTGWSFIRQTCQPAQLNAIQMITRISQMMLHRIILLRFVFLSLRQCTVWNKFVYAISSQLFEVFHSGLCRIFASKSGINIDFL